MPLTAMSDAGVKVGLSRRTSQLLAAQTVLGSARYAEESGRHPSELRNQVTSPGGTTTEGLLVLEAAGLRAAFAEAIQAAYEKAQELGG